MESFKLIAAILGIVFHSIFEYLPVSSLKAASEVIKKIVINAAK